MAGAARPADSGGTVRSVCGLRPLTLRFLTLLRDPHIYTASNLRGQRRGCPLLNPFECRNLFRFEEESASEFWVT